MTHNLRPTAILFPILLLVTAACGNTSTSKSTKISDTQWDVSVHRVPVFDDTIQSMIFDSLYTIADTAQVNALLKELHLPNNISVDWTIPNADGTIWLVPYEKDPLLSEKVTLTEATPINEYDETISVAFKFTDTAEWARITANNIAHRLAVVVNGQLINAPVVRNEIPSGNCSVAIPTEMIHNYLPELDLETLK